MPSVLRVVVAVVIMGLLARSARAAWRDRSMAVRVWRRIRPRQVIGSVGLLALVLATAVVLMTLVPVTGFGLGTLIGLTGNAVFAPLQVASGNSAEIPGVTVAATNWVPTLLTALFLAGILTMFPWLAYVEEQVFRSGLEGASLGRQLWSALKFGLTHLLMFVPLAAALAIAVAGFWYGRVYRRRFTELAAGELLSPGRARSEALLASTVWHTTFNSVLVLLVLTGVILDAVL